MELSDLNFVPFGDLISFAINLLNLIIALSALLAVAYLVYAGFLYITSRGDGDKAEKAQKVIIYTLIGLVIVFISPLVIKFILETIINVN
jgi:threonine/homoserine/homoserine lactone efflux protein